MFDTDGNEKVDKDEFLVVRLNIIGSRQKAVLPKRFSHVTVLAHSIFLR